MGGMASQITSLTIVYSSVYSGADQRKHQSAASLAFVRRIHRWPVNSPHKRSVTRKMFSFDDVIMIINVLLLLLYCMLCSLVILVRHLCLFRIITPLFIRHEAHTPTRVRCSLCYIVNHIVLTRQIDISPCLVTIRTVVYPVVLPKGDFDLVFCVNPYVIWCRRHVV